MNNHNSLHKHIKENFIQYISRFISSPEITHVITRTVLFNTYMDVLIRCHRVKADKVIKVI